MGIFRRKFFGRTSGAFLFAFVLFAPSAAGACATTPYSYNITYTPLNTTSTPPASEVAYTRNYFEPRTVAQSSMASLPVTINTATPFDNGTGLATSSQLRPAALDASSVTYNYQINRWVDTSSWVAQWVDTSSWGSQWVDTSSWVTQWVDTSSWGSQWVDTSSWVAQWVNTSHWGQRWVDTSHSTLWAYNSVYSYGSGRATSTCGVHYHYNKTDFSRCLSPYGNADTFLYNYNNPMSTHSTGYWNNVWVSSGYWNNVWVSSGYWNNVWVSSGYWNNVWVSSGYWQNVWVSSGYWNNVWVSSGFTATDAYTARYSIPPGAFNVTYNANYIAQDQYISTARVPGGSAYAITYNYATTLTGCALPT